MHNNSLRDHGSMEGLAEGEDLEGGMGNDADVTLPAGRAPLSSARKSSARRTCGTTWKR